MPPTRTPSLGRTPATDDTGRRTNLARRDRAAGVGWGRGPVEVDRRSTVASERHASYRSRTGPPVPPSGARPDTVTEARTEPALRGVEDLVDWARRLVDDGRDRSDAEAVRSDIAGWERLASVAATGLAEAVRRLDHLGGVAEDGAATTAEWLTANTRRSGRDAARLARLATNLPDLPETRDALASGRITDEAADAVVRAARDGRLGSPGDVDGALVELAATSSPEDLRARIRQRQQAADATAMLRDERRQQVRRSARLWRKRTGMWGLAGELPDEVGQQLRTALDAFDHPDPPSTPDEQRRRPDQRLADALAALTGAALDRGLAPGTGGIVRPHLSVLVHADTVSADLAHADAHHPDAPTAAPSPDDPRWADLPGGELPWGGTLSPQAVRRICCDASVSRIVMAGTSQVLDVGRATREWSGPQRRAINARDHGCRGPSCSRPIAWTQVHHLLWWRRGGATSVDNGLALCHHCHRLVHDRGWTVELDPATATATWRSPAGTTVVTRPHRPATTHRRHPHRRHRTAPVPEAPKPEEAATGTSPPVGPRKVRTGADPPDEPATPQVHADAPSTTPPSMPATGVSVPTVSSPPGRGDRTPIQPRLDVAGTGGAGGIPRS